MRRAILMFILLVSLESLAFGQWSTPVRLPGPINSDPSVKTWPSINAGGDTLYYAKLGDGGNENICYSYGMADSTWSAPQFPSGSINTPQRELSPSIGPGDSVLYFVSYGRAGGYGDYDIWLSRRGADGRWQEPENAGPNINSAGMEWGVFLARSGHTLYFSSTRLHTGNGLDILKSEWQGDGWGPAIELPGSINGVGSEENVSLPGDETWLILTQLWYGPLATQLMLSNRDSAGWRNPSTIVEFSAVGNEDGASLSSSGDVVYLAFTREDSNHFRSELFISRKTSSVPRSRETQPTLQKSNLSPNPTMGSLRITLGSLWCHQVPTLTIYDILGRSVVRDFRLVSGSDNLTYMISNLPSGRYWVRLSSPPTREEIPLILLR